MAEETSQNPEPKEKKEKMAKPATEKAEKAPKAEKEPKNEKAPKDVKETKEAKPKAAAKKAKKRRLVEVGNAYIQASYNNTIVTITELNGEVIAWSSSGASGFKGARKATPYAAQVSAENAAEKGKVFGLARVHVHIKGVGSGREQAVRGLVSSGLDILSISDLTPIPHNGCRQKKARRV